MRRATQRASRRGVMVKIYFGLLWANPRSSFLPCKKVLKGVGIVNILLRGPFFFFVTHYQGGASTLGKLSGVSGGLNQ